MGDWKEGPQNYNYFIPMEDNIASIKHQDAFEKNNQNTRQSPN